MKNKPLQLIDIYEFFKPSQAKTWAELDHENADITEVCVGWPHSHDGYIRWWKTKRGIKMEFIKT